MYQNLYCRSFLRKYLLANHRGTLPKKNKLRGLYTPYVTSEFAYNDNLVIVFYL